MDTNPTTPRDLVGDGATRAVAAVGLAGVALIHILGLPGLFTETPYLGALFVASAVGSVVVAGWLLFTGSRLAWGAALALPALVLIGFVLSRTTGLPHDSDDIGNWSEPLGIASMFVEGSLVALSAAALAFAPARVTRVAPHSTSPATAERGRSLAQAR
jgi:hypothetical protein